MPQTLPTLESEVQAIAENEARAMSTGDIQLYFSLLADDAIYLPPNSSRKQGEELRTRLREFLENFTVEWLRFDHGATLVAGDLATHDYSYAMVSTPKDESEPIISAGKGLLVCRLIRGEWKIVRNIWNQDPHERPGVR